MPSNLPYSSNKVLSLNPFVTDSQRKNLFPFAYVSIKSRWLTHIFIWCFGYAVFFFFFSRMENGQPLARVTINSFFLLFCHYCCRYLVSFFFETKRYYIWAITTIGLTIILCFPRTFIEIYFLNGPALKAISDHELPVFGFLKIYFFFLITGLLFNVISSLYVVLKKRRTLEVDIEKLEMQHTQAQLNFLKAQLNPHFLFNTLNNIYSAATMQHPKTPDMIMRLSQLLQYVTYDGQQKKVPLAFEVEQMKAYIELFQLKSPNPLAINFTIDGVLSDKTIEPLLLIPFIENALKHGNVADETDNVYLNVTIKIVANKLLFAIENTFDKNKIKDKLGGVGIENIKQRLWYQYPKKHSFKIEIVDNVYKSNLMIEF